MKAREQPVREADQSAEIFLLKLCSDSDRLGDSAASQLCTDDVWMLAQGRHDVRVDLDP